MLPRGEIARGGSVLCALLLAASACAPGSRAPGAAERSEPGLEVTAVHETHAAEAAGIRLGDRVVAWRAPEGDVRPLRFAAQLRILEIELAPRGDVELLLGDGRSVSLGPLKWGLDVEARGYGPSPGSPAASPVEKGLELRGRIAEVPTAEEAVALATLAAEVFEEHERWDDFAAAYDRLWGRGDVPDDVAAELLRSEAVVLVGAGRREDAFGALERALGLLSSRPDRQLLRADLLRERAGMAVSHRHLDLAEEDLRASLAIVEAEVPGSLAAARSKGKIGALAVLRGQSSLAKAMLEGALAAEEEVDPRSITAGTYLSNLAGLAARAGDLVQAEQYLRRYAEILEARGGSPARIGSVHHNLGSLLVEQRDLDGARASLLRALAIKQEGGGDPTLSVAKSLSALAEVERMRGDLESARVQVDRALAIKRRVAPGSLTLASSLGAAGNIHRDLGDHAAAAALYEEAGAIFEREVPGSYEVATLLSNQSNLEHRRGNDREAYELQRRALEIMHQLAPLSLPTAEILRSVGSYELELGRAEEGVAHLSQAFEIASSTIQLVGISDLEGRRQVPLLASYAEPLLEALAPLRSAARIYATIERAHALRSLPTLSSGSAPAALVERLAAEAERLQGVQRQLRSSSTSRADDIRALVRRIEEIREEQRKLWREIALSSFLPDLFATAGVAQIQRSLAADSVFLAYFPTPTAIVGFALAKEGEPSPFAVAQDRERLRQLVSAFQLSVREGRLAGGVGRRRLERVREYGEELYEILLGSVPMDLTARRLVISSSAPVSDVAFQALTNPATGRYLIEENEVSWVLSGSHLVQAAASSAPVSERTVAFGGVPFAALSGAPDLPELRALPGTLKELESVESTYRAPEVLVGAAASETAFKNIGESRLVHLSTHAWLREDSPLDSALAFAPDSQNDGVLHLWELLSGFRLETDLMVLPACDAGGADSEFDTTLLNLVSAFRSAGTRSVLTSDWTVHDASAPLLVAAFYRSLSAGGTKAGALREAQIELLRHRARPELSAPCYWAGYSLYGAPE